MMPFLATAIIGGGVLLYHRLYGLLKEDDFFMLPKSQRLRRVAEILSPALTGFRTAHEAGNPSLAPFCAALANTIEEMLRRAVDEEAVEKTASEQATAAAKRAATDADMVAHAVAERDAALRVQFKAEIERREAELEKCEAEIRSRNVEIKALREEILRQEKAGDLDVGDPSEDAGKRRRKGRARP